MNSALLLMQVDYAVFVGAPAARIVVVFAQNASNRKIVALCGLHSKQGSSCQVKHIADAQCALHTHSAAHIVHDVYIHRFL